MAFRYLIYRTDFGDTIVRESSISGTTGVTEAELFTDFVIPEIQPLYLWRVTGGTTVVPNTDQNINDWLDYENPIGPDDNVTYHIFTGYTAQTAIDLDGKINIVTGATGNIGEFDSSGNLVDTGWQISGLTGGSGQDVYVSGMTYVGSTLTLQRTEGFSDLSVTIVSSGNTDGVVSGATLTGQILSLQRTEGLPDVTVNLSGLTSGIEGDIIALSGAIDQNTSDIVYISGVTDSNTIAISGNTADIITISGDVIQNTDDIITISGDVIQNTADIITISGDVIQNTADITYISGITDTKLDTTIFNTYSGDTRTELDLTITGATNGLQTIDRDVLLGGTLTIPTTIAGAGNSFVMTGLDQFFLGFSGVSTIQDSGSNGGIRYAADYSSSFIDRSLVDKAYVDAIASGLDLKESVRVATTSGETDIDLTGGTFGGTIDGYALLDGDRVLIKNQDSSQKDNGIWIWSNGSSTFARAIDFDNPYVTAGAFTFVERGNTHANSGWVLTTNDPISVGTTPLTFTQFSSAGTFTAGVGIDITSNVISFDGASVAGTNLSWSGTQLNVFGLVDESVFTGYTASTNIRITNIETDISTISGDVITNTNNIAIVSAQTITNENNIITLSGDVENLYNIVSGLTGGSFVDIDTFTGYTATTDIRITNIETDISTISGDVITLSGDLITLSAETANKLDISVFTGYTASTQANELFVIHTGGTDLNTVAVTAIDWHSGITIGSAYSITAGTSTIEILENGEYEITYNVPFNQTSGASDRAIGGNIVKNNVDIIDITAAAGFTTGSGYAGSVGLSSVNLSLSIGDKLDLVCFRTAKSGVTNSSPNGSLLIKKKSTLQ